MSNPPQSNGNGTGSGKLSPGQIEALDYVLYLIQSGYAGVDVNGNIKDRRFHYGLTPMQKNESMKVPEPKELESLSPDEIIKYGTLDRKFNPR